jgi:hypothetical protein
MEINCENVIERYFLNHNPLYAFSLPLSILIAIIVFGFAKAYNWSNNSYINQILIPILALVLSLVIIDCISRLILPKKEMSVLVDKCKLWVNNPKFNKIEKFSSENENVNEYENEYENGNENGNENENENENENGNENENENEYGNEYGNENFNSKKNIYTENIENPIESIGNLNPSPLESIKYDSKCIESSNNCNICSGTNSNPLNLVAPIPGPNWLPQTAEAVQKRLVNNDYTSGRCPL